MRSIDFVARKIKEDFYRCMKSENELCDFIYYCNFKQRYKNDDKWTETSTIAYIADYPITSIDFIDDFYEGQTEVKDLILIPLYKITELIRKGKLYDH